MRTITVPLYKGKRKIYYHDSYDERQVKTIVFEVFKAKHYEAGYNAVKDKKNPIIFDIGANIGATAIYFSQIKGARIYSFEPSLKNYETLVKNTEGLNVRTFNYGVAAFNSDTRQFGEESIYCKRRGISPSEIVKLRTLSWILDREGLMYIDLIKIDVEGAEYEIMFSEGFKDVADKIDYIVGEAHWGIGTFAPQDIPPFLGKYKFKTEFLPIMNYIRGWEVDFLGDGGESSTTRLVYNTPTMFLSKRYD